MSFRGFKASREDRRLLGSFRNFSGRMKRRLDQMAKEFGVVVTLNEDSSVPTIEHLDGASAYDIAIGNDRLVTVSVYIDGLCKNVFLQATGPLYGHGLCSAYDTTFELMMTKLSSLLRKRTAQAA